MKMTRHNCHRCGSDSFKVSLSGGYGAGPRFWHVFCANPDCAIIIMDVPNSPEHILQHLSKREDMAMADAASPVAQLTTIRRASPGLYDVLLSSSKIGEIQRCGGAWILTRGIELMDLPNAIAGTFGTLRDAKARAAEPKVVRWLIGINQQNQEGFTLTQDPYGLVLTNRHGEVGYITLPKPDKGENHFSGTLESGPRMTIRRKSLRDVIVQIQTSYAEYLADEETEPGECADQRPAQNGQDTAGGWCPCLGKDIPPHDRIGRFCAVIQPDEATEQIDAMPHYSPPDPKPGQKATA